MHDYILVGLLGWADTVATNLIVQGLDAEYLRKANAVIIYNTTEAKIRQAINSAGFSGGKIIALQ